MIFQFIDQNGDVILGKKFAGRLVALDQTEPGVWTARLGKFVADDEKSPPQRQAGAKRNRRDTWRGSAVSAGQGRRSN